MSLIPKLRVALFGKLGGSATIEQGATNGATVGTNLYDANGNLVNLQALISAAATAAGNAASANSNSLTTTDDLDEGEYNLYFTVPRAQDAVGSILENSANVTLAYVSHTSIKADLTEVTLTAGGTLSLLGFDAYGRLSETAAASTTNLSEGTNLYFTTARVQAYLTTVEGQPNGIATLDSGGKLPVAQLPAVAINETYVAASQAAMLALTANVGDLCVRTDVNETFILQAQPATTLSNWVQILFPTGGVTSFNGRAGPVAPANGDYSFSMISGTASIAQGGTGQTTALAAFNALSPLSTNGDMLVFVGGVNARVAAGTNGYVWTMVAGVPAWAPSASGLTHPQVMARAVIGF